MGTSTRGEKKRVLHVGAYEIGRTLGNGSFGKVKLGTNVFTKEKVAVKFFNHKKFATSQQKENTGREIEIMKLLAHPNIVKLIDVIENPEESTTYLIAEYVSGGELFDYIVANGVVKEKQARHFLRQIISAVEFVHANLVVHRDLKPENLLLDGNGNIKISDFGLSNIIQPGKLLDSFCGSPLYAAPEILLAERYVGPPIDVWSIGVILFALLCGHLPWNGESQAEISHNSIKGIYDEPHQLSVSGRDIIRKMLTPNPKDRITIAEIRKHPWMNEGYNEPPVSLLTVRQPVLEIRDEIIGQLMSLGFKREDEIRKQILDNECCQAVAMYHLILDRKVTEELADIKRSMSSATTPTDPSITNQPNGKQIVSKLNMKGKKPQALFGASPLRNSTLTAIVEEEANEISPAEWSKIEQCNVEEGATSEAIETTQPSTSNEHSSNYHHQHDHQENKYTSFSSSEESRSTPSRDCGRTQLSSSAPGLFLHEKQRHRRYSVTNDSATYNRSPQTADEFGCADKKSNNRGHNSQRRDSNIGRQAPDSVPQPRGRRFSLDSRAAQNKQLSQEHGGEQQKQEVACSGAPRLVKGVFKSSTTTTKPPSEAAKLVKKVLSNSDSFFVKRKSPYLFECIDEENGVKFQLEVCRISQLEITGIHLKRLVGDIWIYKNMCTTLVNRLCL